MFRVYVWATYKTKKDKAGRTVRTNQEVSSTRGMLLYGGAGHAAVEVEGRYITWSVMPIHGFRNFNLIQEICAHGQYKQIDSYDADVNAMKGDADHVIDLPSEQDGFDGLDPNLTLRWWDVFRSKHNPEWRQLKESCASVTATALVMGNASMFAPAPRPRMWTPSEVADYARKLQQAIDRVRQGYQSIRQSLLEQHARTYGQFPSADPPHGHDGIWTVDTFKKCSDAGLFAHRYELLQKIDRWLLLYHLHSHETTPGSMRANLYALSEIIGLIHKQSLERPDSKRKGALFTLAEQVIARGRELTRKMEAMTDVVAEVAVDSDAKAKEPQRPVISEQELQQMLSEVKKMRDQIGKKIDEDAGVYGDQYERAKEMIDNIKESLASEDMRARWPADIRLKHVKEYIVNGEM